MRQKKRRINLHSGNIIGTIHTMAGFAAASRVALDAVEVRVDALPRPPEVSRLQTLSHPAILTVRRYDEGGARPLADEERRSLYLELLPAAAAVDLELNSLRRLHDVAEAARRQGKIVIASFHDFQTTPSLLRLRGIVARARALGADVVKIATKTETAGDVARLLALLEKPAGPISVMGMGALGRASRLLFARAGSALNYGWLDKPQVPGQWSARDFVALLAEA